MSDMIPSQLDPSSHAKADGSNEELIFYNFDPISKRMIGPFAGISNVILVRVVCKTSMPCLVPIKDRFYNNF